MFVKDWMSKNVVTVNVDDSMQQAIALLKENKIRMLPVLKKGKLVGVLSDSDLKRASPSDATLLDIHEQLYLISKVKVEEIMTPEPVTVPSDYTVEEAAQLLFTQRISGAPVLDETGEVVGTITRDDLFRVLITVTGLGKRGMLFGFLVEDRPGAIKEICNVIRGYGGRLAGVLICYDCAPEGFRTVYIRAYSIDREKMDQFREELKQTAVLLSIVDHRTNKREIFHELGAVELPAKTQPL